MKSMRRIANVVSAAILLAVIAELIYMAATGQIPADKRLGMIGGAIFIGAVIFAGIFARRRKKQTQHLSHLTEDAHAIIRIAASPLDTRVISASFLVAAFGCVLIALEASLELENRIVALVGAVLFLGLPVLALFKGRSASLELSPEGLDFSGFGTGPIAWADLRGATIKTTGKINYISLDLREPEKYLARRPNSVWHFLERLRLASPFSFSPPAIGADLELVHKAIQIRLSTFGQSGSPAA